MARNLTRRRALGLGRGATCALVGTLLASCSDSRPSAQEHADDASVPTPPAFAGLVGMDAQDAWEQLVGERWYVLFEQSDAAGEPRTVAHVRLREDVEVRHGGCLDAEGDPHDELGGGWRSVLEVGVAGAAMIPAHVTLSSPPEAIRQLRETGLANVTVCEEGNVDRAASIVLRCEPGPCAWVPLDGEVTLTITSDVEMPDLAGMSPTEATAELMHRGLTADPEVFSYEYPPHEERGPAVVVSTSPAAGEVVRVGTVVHVTYDQPVEDADSST